MTRFWMRSLAAQISGLLLLGMVGSFYVGCLIHCVGWRPVTQAIVRDELLARAASVTRLLDVSAPERRGEILRAASTGTDRYWTASAAPGDPIAWQEEARRRLLAPLPASAPPGDASGEPANPLMRGVPLPTDPGARWETLPAQAWSLGRAAELFSCHESWEGLGLAVRLESGEWLYAVSVRAGSHLSYYVSIGTTTLIVMSIALVIAIRIARPLRDLTRAAERVGRGEDVAPLPLRGPSDIRLTTDAFNRMQERLRRFVEDRTRMLAAAGHDLRTPITSLRLQAEFVGDGSARERMLDTLDEMEATTEAVLTFAREEAVTEPSRAVDLAALLGSLCDDLADLGWEVCFRGDDERVLYRCRPAAIRRGLRNVIENAVRYGERARVSLVESGDWLEIAVEDDGPGIPPEDAERVFAPFVRLDTSRNRATGGVGLGLAIARSVARGHGGDVTLARGGGGRGLRATIRLPRDVTERAVARRGMAALLEREAGPAALVVDRFGA